MQDLGKLVLRLNIGGLMLLHGLSKIQNYEGTIQWLSGVMASLSLPAFMAYGVFLGEVIAPALLILGILPRLSSLAIIATMAMAILSQLVGENARALFSLGGYGGWNFELQGLYLFGALAILLMGSGKFSLYGRF